jgi:hypothetical protein
MVNEISTISSGMQKNSQKIWIKTFLSEFGKKWSQIDYLRNMLLESVVHKIFENKNNNKPNDEILLIMEFISNYISMPNYNSSYLSILFDNIAAYLQIICKDNTVSKDMREEIIKKVFVEWFKVINYFYF